MRRSRVTIYEISEWKNLVLAFTKAAYGKRGRPDVEAYRCNLDAELTALKNGLLHGNFPVGKMRKFSIRDPKPRIICAPCFPERVLHHAIMNKLGPVLDRSLVDDSYACRSGKGALVAVRRAQSHMRRSPWFAQIDISRYFASINHVRLLNLLERRFSDHDVLALLTRIVEAHEDTVGCGLPIGALTSQHLANFYLSSADRTALKNPNVVGYVRYMDDMVWWGKQKSAVRCSVLRIVDHLETNLHLEVKLPLRVGRSSEGMTFCGFRICTDRLLLSRRKKRRYAILRKQAERAYLKGEISGGELQSRIDAVLAITAHADAAEWRRRQLARRPVASALHEA